MADGTWYIVKRHPEGPMDKYLHVKVTEEAGAYTIEAKIRCFDLDQARENAENIHSLICDALEDCHKANTN